ncbi:Transcription factor TFIIIB component B [Actinomortierella wolfii]|nr:Transcription factor TFIIIB component B [Actinomortierella wolfii]
MSLTSSRVDKGTTRFAPKLKARPARKTNTTASASDESTPVPTTPSTVDQSAASSTSFTSTSTFESQSNRSTPSTTTPTPAGTPIISPSSKSTYSALTQQPTSSSSSASASPVVTQDSPQIGPKSPTFSASRLREKGSNISSSTISTATAASSPLSTSVSTLSLSSPSTGAPVVASSPASSTGTAISIPGSSNKRTSITATVIDTPTSSNARRASTSASGKQASLITVPTSRSRHSISGDQNDISGAGSTGSTSMAAGSTSKRRASVQKLSDRAKKSVKRRQSEEGNEHDGGDGYAEGGEDDNLVDEDDEDYVPDYSNTPMFEFVRDMGCGRRSAMYQEKELLWEQQREREREARKRREAGLEDVQDNKGRFIKEATPKPRAARSFGPKVRVVDGKMVLDEESLQIDHADLEEPQDEGPMEYVEESASTTYINSSSYSSKNRAEKWTPRETELFYEALSQWGTDFGIIQKLFPKKSRIAVRNKFKREDRINKARVEAALTNKTPIDLEQYSQMTATTFSNMTEEEILKNIQKEEEEKAQQLIKSEEGQELEEEQEPEPEPEPEEEIVEEIVGTI